MHFHILQHVEFETPGYVADWIRDRGHSLSYTRLFGGETLPDPDMFDALVILGGPMSIHDEAEFPWLRPEKAFIGETIRQKKKILGICLGSQLIAAVSGARVYPNPEKEIGFLPLHWTVAATKWLGGKIPADEPVFHWHGETFDLPEGAVHLASTDGCVNQGFLLGPDILALQFHLEVTPDLLRDMIAHEGHELTPDPAPGNPGIQALPAPYVQTADAIRQQSTLLTANNRLLEQLLDSFFTSPAYALT